MGRSQGWHAHARVGMNSRPAYYTSRRAAGNVLGELGERCDYNIEYCWQMRRPGKSRKKWPTAAMMAASGLWNDVRQKLKNAKKRKGSPLDFGTDRHPPRAQCWGVAMTEALIVAGIK